MSSIPLNSSKVVCCRRVERSQATFTGSPGNSWNVCGVGVPGKENAKGIVFVGPGKTSWWGTARLEWVEALSVPR